MPQDTIFIRQLKTRSLIGILPHERIHKQTLIIDIELSSDFSQAQTSDDIAHALDYAAISDFIDHFAQQAQYQLLERFANELCQALFAQFATQSIRLEISKPGAIAHTREVGLIIKRQRHESSSS